MRRLVCAFVVRNPPKTGFLVSRPKCFPDRPDTAGIGWRLHIRHCQYISGVSQGTLLGHLLALILSTTSGTVFSQVPGCLLMIASCTDEKKSQEDCQFLQEDLNRPAEWEKKWGHLDKCSSLQTWRSRNPITASFTLNGHTLVTDDLTQYQRERESGTAAQPLLEPAHWPDYKEREQHAWLLREDPKVNNEATKTATGTETQAVWHVLIDFSLTVKAETLIFISGRGSAISSAKEGKSWIIYHLVKS